LDAKLGSNALDAFKRQVSLAPLDSAHVGAMYAQYVSKCLLAESLGLTIGQKVAAEDPLEIAPHATDSGVLLLDSLQTYE
jgi:hypothetical protein